MEFALKEVMKAEDNRVAELREILIGEEKAALDGSNQAPIPPAKLNSSQAVAFEKIIAVQDVGFIHGPLGTGKTTTLVQAINSTKPTATIIIRSVERTFATHSSSI